MKHGVTKTDKIDKIAPQALPQNLTLTAKCLPRLEDLLIRRVMKIQHMAPYHLAPGAPYGSGNLTM